MDFKEVEFLTGSLEKYLRGKLGGEVGVPIHFSEIKECTDSWLESVTTPPSLVVEEVSVDRGEGKISVSFSITPRKIKIDWD